MSLDISEVQKFHRQPVFFDWSILALSTGNKRATKKL